MAGAADQQAWTADRISLALKPLAATGPANSKTTLFWSGRGSYDRSRDELTVESAPVPQALRHDEEEGKWIVGDQKVRIKGIRSWPATDVEAAAGIDLDSLGNMLAAENESWSGRLDALVRARPDHDPDLWNLDARLDLREAVQKINGATRLKLDGDAAFAVKASYSTSLDSLQVREMGLRAPYVQLDGTGKIQHLTASPALDLSGTLGLDWAAIEDQLAEKVEPGARITGHPRPWRLSGTLPDDLAVDRLGTLRGDIGIEIDSLDIFGMRLSQTPLVLRAADGRLTIDPIDARLNGGVLHADPQIVAQERQFHLARSQLGNPARGRHDQRRSFSSGPVVCRTRARRRHSRAGPSVL